MLQQTQVQTVIPYFNKFITSFPDVSTLAKADQSQVLAHWAGLGYYRRAKNLHAAAKIVCAQYQAQVPIDPTLLITLPGIGQSTAHAIASIAGGKPFAILDANVKRVLARYYAVEQAIDTSQVEKKLWTYAQQLMPKSNCRIYTQGMMDIGASICAKKPLCQRCPLADNCQALLLGLQNTIPNKKPKKIKPTKEAYFVLFVDNDSIFLIKRPSDGIWPDLWSLPEYESLEQLANWQECEKLTIFKHSFTHYHLIMKPIRICTTPNSIQIPGQWFSFSVACDLGIPSPIKKILLQYQVVDYLV